jgi:hypothetical protein
MKSDGTISRTTMPDYLHPTEVTYRAMAGAIRPHLEAVPANSGLRKCASREVDKRRPAAPQANGEEKG